MGKSAAEQRDNKKATKTKLNLVELAALRTKNNLRQKKYLKNKTKRLINKPPPVAFKSRLPFGKAIKKVN
ncbi:unnamed protein product [Didymodactylos carnosus]|uniref:Uncharacterized protein n=1 Tax=Didymodactylos carnosus TaxID=1234261 RepID=A0A814CW97_9BILA|nr:unnamed protein product [Didymodactylos carnosus]CAF1396298.1 unnamed protein product [Didymodactylos carnosus]CAF3725725.1 unnamed protein product [Didymodactylos carnosus]CAF4203781.1 unnamed protein product [Didymodactylos carnosus]